MKKFKNLPTIKTTVFIVLCILQTVNSNAQGQGNQGNGLWKPGNGIGPSVVTNRNVGIKTNSPDEALEIIGNVRITDTLKVGFNSMFLNSTQLGVPGTGSDEITSSFGIINLGNNIVPFSNIRLGIGTTNPRFTLELAGDGTNTNGGILAIGSLFSGPAIPAGLQDPRMIWYPRKAAFRVGDANDDFVFLSNFS